MVDYDSLVAEFFFYTVGDESAYNQELNDLFVCYTLSRGLQKPSDQPKRPPLPLELILLITRYAGFIDPKPDLELTMDIYVMAKRLTEEPSGNEFYLSGRFDRVELASMARLQLVTYHPKHDRIYYDPFNLNPYKWAFLVLGTQEERLGFPSGSKGILASLYPCHDEAEVESLLANLNGDATISDTFPPDHAITRHLESEDMPCIVAAARQRSWLVVWRWWEPRFL